MRQCGTPYVSDLKYSSPCGSPAPNSPIHMSTQKKKPKHATALSFDTDVKVVPIPRHSEVRFMDEVSFVCPSMEKHGCANFLL